jgi:hypothetical protein
MRTRLTVSLVATVLTLALAPASIPADGTIHDAFLMSALSADPQQDVDTTTPSHPSRAEDDFWRTGTTPVPSSVLPVTTV